MDRMLRQPDGEWGNVVDLSHQEADDLLDVLAGVKIFETLTGEELRRIERIVHRRVYLPEEVVVHQGNPGLGMYIIQSGSADVLLEAEDGRMIRLATLGDGQFFGEMSLLDGAPRAASVVTVEKSRIIGFFRADLMDLIAHSPRLGFKIVLRISQLMSERLGETLQEFRLVQRSLHELQEVETGGNGGAEGRA